MVSEYVFWEITTEHLSHLPASPRLADEGKSPLPSQGISGPETCTHRLGWPGSCIARAAAPARPPSAWPDRTARAQDKQSARRGGGRGLCLSGWTSSAALSVLSGKEPLRTHILQSGGCRDRLDG